MTGPELPVRFLNQVRILDLLKQKLWESLKYKEKN